MPESPYMAVDVHAVAFKELDKRLSDSSEPSCIVNLKPPEPVLHREGAPGLAMPLSNSMPHL